MERNIVGKEGKKIKNGIRKYESGPYNYSRHPVKSSSKFYIVYFAFSYVLCVKIGCPCCVTRSDCKPSFHL
jgi:hypothetical protein